MPLLLYLLCVLANKYLPTCAISVPRLGQWRIQEPSKVGLPSPICKLFLNYKDIRNFRLDYFYFVSELDHKYLI